MAQKSRQLNVVIINLIISLPGISNLHLVLSLGCLGSAMLRSEALFHLVGELDEMTEQRGGLLCPASGQSAEFANHLL